MSEACNIGMTRVINPNVEALTRSRLVHVDQYYLRSDTIAAANAALIEAQAQVPIVKFWGQGLLGIGQMVVPGTPRDSLFILDALLNLDGGVKPEMVATDNASYSDMVFGIFKMLGYRFPPALQGP